MRIDFITPESDLAVEAPDGLLPDEPVVEVVTLFFFVNDAAVK
jgi:hypothetical protein